MITSIRQFYPDQDFSSLEAKTIEEIQNHPFAFGFERAFLQPDSKIINDKGVFKIEFEPAKETDEEWFGDCVSDILLNGKQLTKAGIPFDTYETKLVQQRADLSIPHYQIITREKHPQIIEHSNWYKKLHPNQSSDPRLLNRLKVEEPLTHRIALEGRTFNEFSITFKSYLQLITIKQDDQNRLYRDAKIYEQYRGRITNAYVLANIPGNRSLYFGKTNDRGIFHSAHMDDETCELLSNMKNTLNIIDSKLEQSGFEI